MSEITETQRVDIKRTVLVKFDPDERLEYSLGDIHYQVLEARMTYQYANGKWSIPWSVEVRKSRLRKDGSWGKGVWASTWEESVLAATRLEYLPNATITVTETNAAETAESAE